MIVQSNNDNLNNECNNIKNYISEYNDSIAKIKEIISNIAMVWEGKDHDYFASQLQSYITELQQNSNQMDSYREYIMGYVKATNTLDNSYGNQKITIE